MILNNNLNKNEFDQSYVVCPFVTDIGKKINICNNTVYIYEYIILKKKNNNLCSLSAIIHRVQRCPMPYDYATVGRCITLNIINI